ncbi:hypothetical protein GYH30_054862 [Glycine max]|nr:hypothetical protein GYH30_054862 [Glycine max]
MAVTEKLHRSSTLLQFFRTPGQISNKDCQGFRISKGLQQLARMFRIAVVVTNKCWILSMM